MCLLWDVLWDVFVAHVAIFRLEHLSTNQQSRATLIVT
jgi:hypothetical protein